MNTSFFIAKRYLLAKKSHNLINIITAVSVVGVAVGAFALIVVLSVFNGFEQVISTMVNRIAPDLVIEPATGKTIDLTSFPEKQIEAIPQLAFYVQSISEDALFRYNEKQHIGRLKAVSSAFQQTGRMDSLMVQGDFVLQEGKYDFAVPGAGVAWYLGVNARNPEALLQVYVPKRGNPSSFTFDQAFSSGSIALSGVFASQQDMDASVVFVPYDWAASLLGYHDEASSIELFLKTGTDEDEFRQTLSAMIGPGFLIKNKFEQQETLYRIMRSEKWAIFIILTFILIMASFNVIGSLSMLIIDKKKDISILGFLGADQGLLQKLFLTEGMLISVAGGLVGLVAGISLVWLQQQFGLLKLGGEEGAFIIDAYPVALQWLDVAAVFATVVAIGWLAALTTVFTGLKRIDREKVSVD